RTLGGGAVLFAVQGGQVGAVRAEQRPAGGGVAGAAAGQAFAQGGGDGFGIVASRSHHLCLSGQAQVGLGEGSVGAGVDGGLQRGQGTGARDGGGGPGLAQPHLQRVEPEGVGGRTLGAVGQQTQ